MIPKSGLPDSWPECVQRIAEVIGGAPGCVMIVGKTDVGKTTLACALANKLVQQGLKVALVDADVGQSDIGPPGTICVGMVQGTISRMSDVVANAGYFVGATSPALAVAEAVIGTKLMVDRGTKLGADAVIVDTTGLIHGSLGRILKQAKFELVRPKYIVAIQRSAEAEHLLKPLEKRSDVSILRVKPSSMATVKSQEMRRNTRQERFKAYFQGSTVRKLEFDEVVFSRSLLGTGARLTWSDLAYLGKEVDGELIYGERLPEGLYAVFRGPISQISVEKVKSRARVGRVFEISEAEFKNLLVGLLDTEGDLLGLGIIKTINFVRREFELLTPVSPNFAISAVQFGHIRVSEFGEELGTLNANYKV